MTTSMQKLFHSGGTGSGFEGHKGRSGVVGGSLPRGSGSGTDPYAGIAEQFREHSGLGVFPSTDQDDPYDRKSNQVLHDTMSKEIYDNLDLAQITSLEKYSNGSYGNINKELRNPEIGYANSEYSDTIDNIDSVLEMPETELSENILIYRGTQINREKYGKVIELLQSARDPNLHVVYQDNGYFSASSSIHRAIGFSADTSDDEAFNIFFEIQVDKGTNVLAMDNRINAHNEEEVLMGRGTKFEILHYTEEQEDMPSDVYDAKIVMRALP
jgi:hypothetical protein